jgi:predicted regulator of Ras-like GTPase activity (Roadblock/LC7/MglB family)
MAIEGRLSEMDIPTLVQYVCNEGQQARLRIEHADQEAFIYFAAGNVVDAELGDQRGEEAFYRILRWEDGAFALESGVAPPTQTIETPWSALLMNGLQQRDEVSWDELAHDEEDYDMPENIQDILEELGGQVPGFISAAVVGMDGLGIADHASTDVNVEAVNAQMTLLIKLVDTTINKLNPTDGVEDYLLTTEDAYLLVRFLEDKQYYLGLAADREDTRLGSMRLNSRIYAERVNEALPH